MKCDRVPPATTWRATSRFDVYITGVSMTRGITEKHSLFAYTIRHKLDDLK